MKILTPIQFNQDDLISNKITKVLHENVFKLDGLFKRMNFNLKITNKENINQNQDFLAIKEAISTIDKFEKKDKEVLNMKFFDKFLKLLNFDKISDIPLLSHQKEGLYWLLQREKFFENISEKINCDQFETFSNKLKKVLNPVWSTITLKRNFFCDKNIKKTLNLKLNEINHENKELYDDEKFNIYIHTVTGQLTTEFPHLGYQIDVIGGLFADEMGLGKTISMLSLIGLSKLYSSHHQKKLFEMHQINNFPKNCKFIESQSNQNNSIKDSSSKTLLGGNLVIVPTTLIDQWVKETEFFFKNNFIKIVKYSGTKSKRKYIKCSNYDIVVTSYGILRSEFANKQRSQLFKTHWLRVICDEATVIHTEKSLTTKSILEIKSVSKWLLTGTPIQNSLDDLYSFVAFLRYKPWSNFAVWKQIIGYKKTKPIDIDSEKIASQLLKPIMLRRTKKKLKNLFDSDKLEIKEIKIKMDSLQLMKYKEGYSLLKSTVEKLKKEDMLSKSMIHIFAIITKLRQICDHKYN